MITTQYDYSSGTGFVYDSTKIGFSGGKAVLLPLDRRNGAGFSAPLSASLNANWSNGSGTGTALGAGAIVGGVLNGNSTSPKGCKWASAGNIGTAQVGCRRFHVTPQFTGAPVGGVCSWYSDAPASGVTNIAGIYMQGTTLQAVIVDNALTTLTTLIAPFSPVSGTTYEIELDFDLTLGHQYLFIDGILVASDSATGTRSLGGIANIVLGQNGNSATIGGQANYSGLVLFDTMQHTSNYTPNQPISPVPTSFATDSPSIAPNMPLTLDNLHAFTDQITVSGSDSVTFYLLIDSVPYWWDGAAWSVSDGTYAKSNRDEDITDNLSTLPVSMGAFITPYALLHSVDGSTTPRLASLFLTYNYFGPEPTLPNLCTVYGYIIDAVEGAIVGATVSWTVDKTYVNQGLFVAQGAITAVTDALGYFSMSLAETTTANTTMIASVKYPGQRGSFTFGKAFIPNAPTVNMATLAFTP